MSKPNYTTESTLNLHRYNLKDRQLFDLEMLMVGGFSLLDGFMGKDDYESVVSDMRMTSGSLFPVPVVLDIPDSAEFAVEESVVLCDQFGNPLAIMDIESQYQPDKQKEVEGVYGTKDMAHPGVRYVINQMHDTYICAACWVCHK